MSSVRPLPSREFGGNSLILIGGARLLCRALFRTCVGYAVRRGHNADGTGEYAFSERYGRLRDKFGLCRQIMFMGGGEMKQKIVPMLTFSGPQSGRAEELLNGADRERAARVTQVFLKMKKFDIAKLKQAAFEGSQSVA